MVLSGAPIAMVGAVVSTQTDEPEVAAGARLPAASEALPKARPVLLEPVLAVEITIPSEALSKATGLVSARRGQILGYDGRPGWQGWDVLNALIPESEIGDLIVELRSATAGVGTFSTRFDHMAELSGRPAELAMAAGKAVVSTGVGGIPDALRDGDNGAMVEPGNAQSLADGLARLLADEEERRRLGTRARATIEQEFESGFVIGQLSAVYKELRLNSK